MSTSSSAHSVHSDDETLGNGSSHQGDVRFHQNQHGFKIKKAALSKLRKGHCAKSMKSKESVQSPTLSYRRSPDSNTTSMDHNAGSDLQSLRRSYLSARRRNLEIQQEFEYMQAKLTTLKHRMSSLHNDERDLHDLSQKDGRTDGDEVLRREYQNIVNKLLEEKTKADEDLASIEDILEAKEMEYEDSYLSCGSLPHSAKTSPHLHMAKNLTKTSPHLQITKSLIVDAIKMQELNKVNSFMKPEVDERSAHSLIEEESTNFTEAEVKQPLPSLAGGTNPSNVAETERSFSSTFLHLLRDLLIGKNAFRLSKAQKKRFSIQAQYDANETFRNLLHWNNTVVKFIFWKPMTWFCISLHYFGFFLTRRLRAECSPAEFQPSQCWYDRWASQYAVTFQDIPVFMTLAAFLFVSYNNMCLRIFERQYFTCEQVTGRITSLAMHTRSVLRDPVQRWDLHRLVLTSQCIFYWNLRRIAAENHHFGPSSEEHPGSWEDMCSRYFIPEDLLTQAECECIGKYRGNRPVLVLAWYERRLRELRAGRAGWDLNLLSAEADRRKFVELMLNHVLEVKGLFSSTMMVGQFAVPFCYYHLTYLVLLMNLVMLAYCFLFINGLKGNLASLIIYPAVVIMLSGLHELANKMSDPFGDDESDLNIDAFLDISVDESRGLCFTPYPLNRPGDHQLLGERAMRKWQSNLTGDSFKEKQTAEKAAGENVQVLTQS